MPLEEAIREIIVASNDLLDQCKKNHIDLVNAKWHLRNAVLTLEKQANGEVKYELLIKFVNEIIEVVAKLKAKYASLESINLAKNLYWQANEICKKNEISELTAIEVLEDDEAEKTLPSTPVHAYESLAAEDEILPRNGR